MPEPSSTRAFPPQIKPSALRRFHAALAKWYGAHGRHDLPWRQTNDPYAIWVSEIMLQQTQVVTVRDRFYGRFLKQFPTVQALANAPREQVLKAWEGLGYYRRAGYLHEAATKIVSGGWWVVGGETPPPLTTHYSLLTSLPGIGRNTAHAIMAFAHHAPVAILEANVKRIVARIFALTSPSDAQLWSGAETLLNQSEPFDYNQAMMDLGSLICTPKNPACEICPAHSICEGKAAPELYPSKKAKKKIPTRKIYVLVRVDAADKIFLQARTDALLGGLYGFAQETERITANDAEPIGEVVHIYSHFRLEAEVKLQQLSHTHSGSDWYSRSAINALPLSGVDHKILELVDRHCF